MIFYSIAVGFSILADEHVERFQEFSTFPSLDLLDGVSAVGQILRLSKAVLVTDQVITLGVLGIVIGACALEIDGELCAFLRSLDLRLADCERRSAAQHSAWTSAPESSCSTALRVCP